MFGTQTDDPVTMTGVVHMDFLRIFEILAHRQAWECTSILLRATKTAEMNELDSHLEKTSEIFEIGSVEKKLQLFKVGNKC